ncbi:biotin/lipoyl-containing protein [Brevibacterium sp. FME17]|nr:biotin/lipoyl-containing protein [Brevibacterium sp. FME17]
MAVDKVDAEVTAPESGTLSHVVAEGGATTQGSVIATIAST